MAGRDVTELVCQVLLVASYRADSLTVPEISARTGLPERTVERHLARARHLSSLARVADGSGDSPPAPLPSATPHDAQEVAR